MLFPFLLFDLFVSFILVRHFRADAAIDVVLIIGNPKLQNTIRRR